MMINTSKHGLQTVHANSNSPAPQKKPRNFQEVINSIKHDENKQKGHHLLAEIKSPTTQKAIMPNATELLYTELFYIAALVFYLGLQWRSGGVRAGFWALDEDLRWENEWDWGMWPLRCRWNMTVGRETAETCASRPRFLGTWPFGYFLTLLYCFGVVLFLCHWI